MKAISMSILKLSILGLFILGHQPKVFAERKEPIEQYSTPAPSSSSQLTIPVDFIVITKDNSAAINKKWLNAKFVQKNLNTAKKHLFYKVHFKLGSIYEYKSTSQYNSLSQGGALDIAVGNRQEKRITVTISGPNTQDAVGLAYVGQTMTPAFAMRSRYNGTDSYSQPAKDNNAYVFLHELAHNMGLDHCVSGSSALCADNVWANPSNAQKMADYIRSVLNYTTEQRSGSDR